MSKAEDTVVIKNIYYMMAYAFKSVDITVLRSLETERFDNILDLMAAILAIGLASQRRRGFEREYISCQEEGLRVIGRIDVSRTMQLKARQSYQISCSYDERKEDTYKNQILKTTAFYLLRSGEVANVRKVELKRILLLMDDIKILDPWRIAWGSLRYHRNNRFYQLLMSICYLVLHDMLMRDISGETKLANVIHGEALSRLYEKFVLEYFRVHHPGLDPKVHEVNRGIDDSAPSFLPRMITDVTLYGPQRTLIIDAKCYGSILDSHFDKKILSAANINQIFTYVMHESAATEKEIQGMLLYAGTGHESIPNSRWVDMEHTYHCRVLDLNCDFKDIAAQLDDIAAIVS